MKIQNFYLGMLPQDLDKTHIASSLEKFGLIHRLKLPKEKSLFRGYGYVVISLKVAPEVFMARLLEISPPIFACEISDPKDLGAFQTMIVRRSLQIEFCNPRFSRTDVIKYFNSIGPIEVYLCETDSQLTESLQKLHLIFKQKASLKLLKTRYFKQKPRFLEQTILKTFDKEQDAPFAFKYSYCRMYKPGSWSPSLPHRDQTIGSNISKPTNIEQQDWHHQPSFLTQDQIPPNQNAFGQAKKLRKPNAHDVSKYFAPDKVDFARFCQTQSQAPLLLNSQTGSVSLAKKRLFNLKECNERQFIDSNEQFPSSNLKPKLNITLESLVEPKGTFLSKHKHGDMNSPIRLAPQPVGESKFGIDGANPSTVPTMRGIVSSHEEFHTQECKLNSLVLSTFAERLVPHHLLPNLRLNIARFPRCATSNQT